ncbi:hypothetical protein OSG_eHP31_00060 [environmental Halophage eHP-31]|nr:hypothetical protein OSG_eHP31_00060 [environmental Halophage eHP-31]
MTRFLYNLAIPEGTTLSQSQRQRQRLLAEGTLSPGSPAVESISADPGERLLSGRVRGRLAAVTAAEFEELFANDSLGPVPLFEPSDRDHADRFVGLEDVQVEPAHPTEQRVQTFDGSLRAVGSRRSHFRALRTNPTTESNPFGSAGSAEVGVNYRASRLRWFDPEGGGLIDATVQRTVSGEHDKISIVDATQPSFGRPVLIYDLPHRYGWRTDARVWDSRAGDKILTESNGTSSPTVGSATVGSSQVGSGSTTAVRWQRVFAPGHDFEEGVPVVESDRLRLRFDDRLRAYRWDASDEQYEQIQLGQSAWRLIDQSIERIGGARVDGQAEFNDGTSTHALNWSVKRGRETVLLTNPPNEGAMPAGLVTRLDPIAATSDEDPASSLDVVPRSEVGR